MQIFTYWLLKVLSRLSFCYLHPLLGADEDEVSAVLLLRTCWGNTLRTLGTHWEIKENIMWTPWKPFGNVMVTLWQHQNLLLLLFFNIKRLGNFMWTTCCKYQCWAVLTFEMKSPIRVLSRLEGSLTSRGLKNHWSQAFQNLETSSELSYYSEILKS